MNAQATLRRRFWPPERWRACCFLEEVRAVISSKLKGQDPRNVTGVVCGRCMVLASEQEHRMLGLATIIYIIMVYSHSPESGVFIFSKFCTKKSTFDRSASYACFTFILYAICSFSMALVKALHCVQNCVKALF